MTTNEQNNEEYECCCCDVLRLGDRLWKEYKHHSGKVAIGLSILGGASSIIVGFNAVAGSVALAITNSAVFFSGVCYEKLKSQNAALENDNQSLRRQTTLLNFRMQTATPSQQSNELQTPESVDGTQYESVQPFRNAPNIF